jgi:Ankyrin repeats (many copies)
MQFGELAGAARAGDVARVRALLAAGADPAPPPADDGWIAVQFLPLWAAVEEDQLGCVHELLAAGAGTQLLELDARRPILTNVSSVEMLHVLLGAGADPTIKPQTASSIVNAIAAKASVAIDVRAEMLRRLVDEGVDLDGIIEHHTALWRAACFVEPGLVEALLGAGANPNAAPSALAGACWPSFLGQIEGGANDIERNIDLIVAAGGDLDERDEHGYGPLHGALMPYNHGTGFASSDGPNAPAARALIRNGLSIDITFDDHGTRPLHIVAGEGDVASIEFLLAAGADPSERTDEGHTPLDAARARLEQMRSYNNEIINAHSVPRLEAAIRAVGG